MRRIAAIAACLLARPPLPTRVSACAVPLSASLFSRARARTHGRISILASTDNSFTLNPLPFLMSSGMCAAQTCESTHSRSTLSIPRRCAPPSYLSSILRTPLAARNASRTLALISRFARALTPLSLMTPSLVSALIVSESRDAHPKTASTTACAAASMSPLSQFRFIFLSRLLAVVAEAAAVTAAATAESRCRA